MRTFVVLALIGCGSDASTPTDAPLDPDAAVTDAPSVDAPLDGPAMLNRCTLAMAEDRTDPGASRTITFGSDDAYTPRCMKIAVGQTVTWSGDLESHPLRPGIVTSQITAQPGTPIPSVSTGTTQAVLFDAGDWAYYCISHLPGMVGVVYVVP